MTKADDTKDILHLVEVTEEEMVKIIRDGAKNGYIAHFHFGPGWAGLSWKSDEPVPPAAIYLARLRGVTTENCDGAGI